MRGRNVREGWRKLHSDKLHFPPNIHSSLVLQPFVGLWSILQFRNISFTQTVGLFGRVISPSQGPYLHRGQRKHRINTHTHTQISMPLSGIRTCNPSVRASEDSLYLRPLGSALSKYYRNENMEDMSWRGGGICRTLGRKEKGLQSFRGSSWTN
jgi:hypothetical protein